MFRINSLAPGGYLKFCAANAQSRQQQPSASTDEGGDTTRNERKRGNSSGITVKGWDRRDLNNPSNVIPLPGSRIERQPGAILESRLQEVDDFVERETPSSGPGYGVTRNMGLENVSFANDPYYHLNESSIESALKQNDKRYREGKINRETYDRTQTELMQALKELKEAQEEDIKSKSYAI